MHILLIIVIQHYPMKTHKSLGISPMIKTFDIKRGRILTMDTLKGQDTKEYT